MATMVGRYRTYYHAEKANSALLVLLYVHRVFDFVDRASLGAASSKVR